jgi:hydrogenase nickel incorporation protein HypA/HybF
MHELSVCQAMLAQVETIAAREKARSVASIVIRVRCLECDAESEAQPNRLLCGACGGYRTQVISGDELLLASVELDLAA